MSDARRPSYLATARKLLRRAIMPVFARINPGDITIHHHFTGDPVRLHSFRHKGYWWHGRRREADTMALFARLIASGDTVIEVGGHIGYIALYFAHLVGPRGQVVVFEPGANNLPYTRANLAPCRNVRLVEKAVGRESGTLPLYLESLTGQNNSFIKDFDGLRANQQHAFRVEPTPVEVSLVTLDSFASESDGKVDFLKIDVEGFECEVLEGAQALLGAQHPAIMVEVQRRHTDVFALLTGLGYVLIQPDGTTVRSADGLQMNTFCLHPARHAAHIQALAHPPRP